MGARRNIDEFVDYKQEYLAVVKGAEVSGDRLTGRCPFHDDNKNSFSVDLKTGKWHCFTEDIGGNFISFWARLKGLEEKEAYKEICIRYHQWDGEPAKRDSRKGPKPYSLKEYAMAKRLPEEFLSGLGVLTGKDRNGISYLKTVYYEEGGQGEPIYRLRYGDKDFRWSRGSSGRLILYGDWRMEAIRRSGKAILVEGESDTQTLWYLTLPALGVPGASNFKDVHARRLEGMDVYIHVEPDRGGETFLAKCVQAFSDIGFSGRVYKWSCSQYGCKDPSDLYIRDGEDGARSKVMRAIQTATEVDLSKPEAALPESMQDAPINLRQAPGYLFSENGVFRLTEEHPEGILVCRTPILITRRIRSIDTDGEEKIELAFRRDGRWTRKALPRSTAFTAKGVVALTDLGCTVTSENARMVVRYLSALEAENLEAIPNAESTSVLGWLPGKRFLPGHGGDIILDVEPSLRGWADGYRPAGSYEQWKADMQEHRENDKFRFILASAFAAPLLRIVRQRIFLVYNWGVTLSGKTAALKAAISAWGDPDRLVANFNATQVALERMAGFYHDLPMAVDERQLAWSGQESLEKIVYMLASGTGRARGTKSGGLQLLSAWQTVVLATGEEPISGKTTQGGVSSRILEIQDGPFEGKEKEGSAMYAKIAMNHGWAGPDFIGRVMSMDEDWIRELYRQMFEEVQKIARHGKLSHASSVAAVALADVLADMWIFQGLTGDDIPEESWNRAVMMAGAIIGGQDEADIPDSRESAVQSIVDLILSNRSNFGDHPANGVSYGTIEDGVAYIYPTMYAQHLEKQGYNERQISAYLEKRGLIDTSWSGGKKTRRVNRRMNGKTCWVVAFHLNKALPSEEDEKKGDEDFVSSFGSTPFDPKVEEDLPFS